LATHQRSIAQCVLEQAELLPLCVNLAAEVAAARHNEERQARIMPAVDVSDDVLEEDVGVLPRCILQPHHAIHECPVLLCAFAARLAERRELRVEQAVLMAALRIVHERVERRKWHEHGHRCGLGFDGELRRLQPLHKPGREAAVDVVVEEDRAHAVEQQQPQQHGGQTPVLALAHDDAPQEDDMAADQPIQAQAVAHCLAAAPASNMLCHNRYGAHKIQTELRTEWL
jgi:hypothetical protein